MIFESHYRRQALAAWKQANELTEDETRSNIEQTRQLSVHPFTRLLAILASLFTTNM